MKHVIIQLQRNFLQNHQQQAANLKDCDQNIEFISKENNNYHQIGNAYLQ